MMSIDARVCPRRNDPHGSVPARFRRIRARVAAQDCAWFAAHPGEERYARPSVPGEFWPDRPPAGVDLAVLVTQLAPGVRNRVSLLHVQRRPGLRMVVLDPFSGFVLPDVPMEGWDR